MDDVKRIERQLTAIESAIRRAVGEVVKGTLKEVHADLSARLQALRSSRFEPNQVRVHDVPTPVGTPFERKFTGTYNGRAKLTKATD